jgi:hypothetical protein
MYYFSAEIVKPTILKTEIIDNQLHLTEKSTLLKKLLDFPIKDANH